LSFFALIPGKIVFLELAIFKQPQLWMIEGMEPTVEEMNEKLFEYLKIYNFLRLHQSLKYKTPAEKFEEYIRGHQGVHHVLNSNNHFTELNGKVRLEGESPFTGA